MSDSEKGSREALKEQPETAESLRRDILENLPYAKTWLVTPHVHLSGLSPQRVIEQGDLARVRQLVNQILYIGIT